MSCVITRTTVERKVCLCVGRTEIKGSLLHLYTNGMHLKALPEKRWRKSVFILFLFNTEASPQDIGKKDLWSCRFSICITLKPGVEHYSFFSLDSLCGQKLNVFFKECSASTLAYGDEFIFKVVWSSCWLLEPIWDLSYFCQKCEKTSGRSGRHESCENHDYGSDLVIALWIYFTIPKEARLEFDRRDWNTNLNAAPLIPGYLWMHWWS